MKTKVNDKEINNMILYLRVNDIMEIYYVDKSDSWYYQDDVTDLRFYDYKTDKHYTREDIVEIAIKNNWKKDWTK
tara:strand:+ start:1406 stop:1630 length:225 start_codon:yes stop_codon:yes gene_type:complete